MCVYYGRVTIVTNFWGHRLIDKQKDKVIEEQKTNNAKSSKAHAFWLEIEDREITESILRAVENMLRVGAGFVIPADRHDTSTHCEKNKNIIYFYENYSGGIGISEKALTTWGNILNKGIRIAEKCSCKKGCPKCIHPPRLKDATMIDKQGGLLLAKELMAMSHIKADERFDKTSNAWRKI